MQSLKGGYVSFFPSWPLRCTRRGFFYARTAGAPGPGVNASGSGGFTVARFTYLIIEAKISLTHYILALQYVNGRDVVSN